MLDFLIVVLIDFHCTRSFSRHELADSGVALTILNTNGRFNRLLAFGGIDS
jgi:hypothetical protein